MPVTLVILHRNRSYARDIGARLTVAAGDSLAMRYAETVQDALPLIQRANRLLFDADDDFIDILEQAKEVRTYALSRKLDASLSAKLFKYGAIAVGTCTTDGDVQALVETIISGVAALPSPTHVLEYLATPGRYARDRTEEDERVLDTALHLTRNNVTKTAELLGVPLTTVQSRLNKKRGRPNDS